MSILSKAPTPHPAAFSHYPESTTQIHPPLAHQPVNFVHRKTTHRALGKLGQCRLWQFVLSHPYAVRLHLDTGRCRRRVRGRFGRVDGGAFGRHL